MSLHVEEEEEKEEREEKEEEVEEVEEEDNHTLVKNSREMNKLDHELIKESIEERAKLITSALRDIALENPFEVEVMKE